MPPQSLEKRLSMNLVISQKALAVVHLPPGAPVPDWATGEPLVSITRTATETSVICPTESLPDEIPGAVEGPLVAVLVEGRNDLLPASVLLTLLKPLADLGTHVITVSGRGGTWILVCAPKIAAAASVWRAAGFHVTDRAPEGRPRIPDSQPDLPVHLHLPDTPDLDDPLGDRPRADVPRTLGPAVTVLTEQENTP
jgi:uncharacterized protein